MKLMELVFGEFNRGHRSLQDDFHEDRSKLVVVAQTDIVRS